MHRHHLAVFIVSSAFSCAASEPAPTAPQAVVVVAATAEHAQGQSQLKRYERITSAVLLKKLEAKESFIFVSLAKMCSLTKPSLEELAAYERAPLPVYVIVFGDDGEPQIEYQSKEIINFLQPSHYATPSLYFVVSGEVRDVSHLLAYNLGLERFIARNISTSFRYTLRRIEGDAAMRREAVSRSGVLAFKDMSGVDMSYSVLKDKSFESSDMRGASFDHAKLINVNFSFTDLRGASFEAATLKNIYWGHATCPDGTASASHEMSCEAHLTPAAVDDVHRDDAGITAMGIRDQMLWDD